MQTRCFNFLTFHLNIINFSLHVDLQYLKLYHIFLTVFFMFQKSCVWDGFHLLFKGLVQKKKTNDRVFNCNGHFVVKMVRRQPFAVCSVLAKMTCSKETLNLLRTTNGQTDGRTNERTTDHQKSF